MAFRSTLALAVAGQLLIIAASVGRLNGWVCLAAVAVAIAIARPWRMRPAPAWIAGLTFVPIAVMAAYPPIAFDETLYHLPFIAAMARSGSIAFLADVRFPVFPQLHEALCVPLFMAFGDTATHFVALLQLAILSGLLFAWPQKREAGWLAAAITLGNPLIVSVAVTTYVEIALTLFVAAGFHCLDRADEHRHRFVFLAGFLLGSTTALKYLGWYFVAAGAWFVLRRLHWYALGVVAGALPMLARIVALTGNPLFPMAGDSVYRVDPAPPFDVLSALRRLATMFFDMTFATHRIGMQAPVTPLFAVTFVLLLFSGRRKLAWIAAAYVVLFAAFMPADPRYLLPIMPLAALAAAEMMVPRLSRRQAAVAGAVALLPFLLYPLHWAWRRGPLPLTAAERERTLTRAIPGYRALREVPPVGRIYTCGGEQLKYYGGARFVGDHFGPDAFSRVFGAPDLRQALLERRIAFVHVTRSRCDAHMHARIVRGPFRRIFADETGELWQLLPPPGASGDVTAESSTPSGT